MKLEVDQSYERPIYSAMPPPKKRYRNGTSECEEAVRDGIIELSLPPFPRRKLSTVIKSLGGKHGSKQSTAFDETGDRPTSGEIVDDEHQENTKIHGKIGVQCKVAPQQKLKPTKVQDKPFYDGPRNASPCSVLSSVTNDGRTPIDSTDGASESNDVVLHDNTSYLYQEPDPNLPRFNDIVGHDAVKLRIEEVLLPIALPPDLAKAILVVGSQHAQFYSTM